MAASPMCLAGKKSLNKGLHMQELLYAIDILFNPILLKDKDRKIKIKTDEVLPHRILYRWNLNC